MKDVTGELELQKKHRGDQYEENKRVRALINDLIADYKQKEEDYKKTMQSKNMVFQTIEANLKNLMEGSVNVTMKQFNDEKLKHEKANDNVRDLTTKI
jgi:hypothetical protein